MLYTINETEIKNKNFIEIIKVIYKDYPDLIQYYEIIWENKQNFKNEIDNYLKTLHHQIISNIFLLFWNFFYNEIIVLFK